MEIIGKLTVKLPEQRGESARGTWVRGGFVIETQEQYPSMVAFTMFMLTEMMDISLYGICTLKP